MEPIQSGKVRELYDNGDTLVLVATDRISCFDVILNNEVDKKGVILTKLSRFWFEQTKDIVPNHMRSVDNQEMPEFFRQERFARRAMLCQKLKMIPVECIVRGYLTGSAWNSYQTEGTICGQSLEELGIRLENPLQESGRLPEPLYTPSIKAGVGEHDVSVSYEQSEAFLEECFPGQGTEYAGKLKEYSLALYRRCAEYALARGIIVADTKFEFGLDQEGRIVLGDELLTPDSSRFWSLAEYEPGHSQPSFDKQLARDWLKANPDSNWTLPPEVVEQTKQNYLRGYEMLTGECLAV